MKTFKVDPKKPPKKSMVVRVDPGLLDRIAESAKLHRTNRSRIVEAALTYWVNEEGTQSKRRKAG